MESKQHRVWRGSICAGFMTSRWPFGKMIARMDHIELRSLLGNFVLTKNEVEFFEHGRFFPWLWMGIQIRHHHDGYPDRLMFSPMLFWRRRRILKHLRLLGYKIA